jgi:Xaa-Pro aminopeptidase
MMAESVSGTHPVISDAEFAERARRLQALVGESEFDILLVNGHEADFANVRYLSDYWPIFESAGVLVPPSGPLTLLIGPESETYAADRSTVPRIRKLAAYRESADPEYPDVAVSTYSDVFEEAGHPDPVRIGIAGSFATNFVMLEALRAAFPRAEIVRADDALTALRSIKSEAELACLREAFRISELAIDAILAEVRPGLTELELVGVAQQAMYANGAEYEGMPQYVLSGPNSRHAISRATHRQLRSGEALQLNISARVSGYSSGVGRVVAIGKLGASQRTVIEFCLEAHQEVASWLREGVLARDVAIRFRQFYTDHGHEDLYLYGPVHGLGLIEVEPPWVETTSDYAFAKDMTFQIDTFALSPEIGVRWENGVRILADGVEAFSGRHMELLEIG